MADSPARIDVHHHMFPTAYLNRERDRILGGIRVDPRGLLSWTPQRSLETMDRNGIATAIVSISTPGIWFGESDPARTLARECAEYAAQMKRDYPGRFGFWAPIPLPDVDGSLRAIEYALDVLKADGIGLLTSYLDKWPGDTSFAPVFDELNRRHTIVFVHPTVPLCCRNLIPGVPPPVTEFLFDTTRAISSLLFSGTFSRCPNVRFIFCHCGGTMPPLAHRMANFGQHDEPTAARLPHGVLYELKRLYFDIANSTNSSSFAGITNLVSISQILFGSDFPFVQIEDTVSGIPGLNWSAETHRAIDRDNAARLMGRA